MAYCTQADIEKRIGAEDLASLSDYDGDGAADAAVVTRAIEDACSQIDSYLQAKYTVPVVPVPAVLRANAVTLSVCVLRLGRDSVTEDHKSECDRVYSWLKDVAAGKAELGIEPKPTESPGAGGIRSGSQPRIFGRGEPL